MSAPEVKINFEATAPLALEGITNELIHAINRLRKQAGLDISARTVCYLQPANGYVAYAAESQLEVIKSECLLNDVVIGDITGSDTEIVINDAKMALSAGKTDTVVTLLDDRILFGEHSGGTIYKNYWEALAARSTA